MKIIPGRYVHPDGVTYNLIGVSAHTEKRTKRKAVFFQMFLRNVYSGESFYHMTLEKFEDELSRDLILVDQAFERPTILCKMEILENAPPGRYRHFKSTDMLYNAINFSIDITDRDENGEAVMLYQPLYGEYKYLFCHRPLAMWSEHVEKLEYNYSGPRFRLIEAYKQPIIARP